MRINVYIQELITADSDLEPDQTIWEMSSKESNTKTRYPFVRLFLHSSRRLHHPPQDDDRSAITFWLPKSKQRREWLARTFEEMAQAIRHAPAEMGQDY